MKNLTFITGNQAKADELSLHLGYNLNHQKLDLPEIQSLSLEEVTTEKANAAYTKLHSPVLVEDTSLEFEALNGLPGPLIKWFLQSIDNEGLLKILTPYENRSAKAEVCFALHNGNEVLLFKGSINGIISNEVKGTNGFGWDPIFIPNGETKTWAEMTSEEKKETSMRKEPLAKLKEYLATL